MSSGAVGMIWLHVFVDPAEWLGPLHMVMAPEISRIARATLMYKYFSSLCYIANVSFARASNFANPESVWDAIDYPVV